MTDIDYSRLTRNCAIRILYRYAGADRSWESARQQVNFRGKVKAVADAQRKYKAVEKAQRDDNFSIDFIEETDGPA